MNPYSVIIKTVISEKSDAVREKHNQYTFVVQRTANKQDVKAAVESLFAVEVAKVNTSITRGKYRRRGMRISRAANHKKALVTLAKGQKLDIFEG